MRLSSLLYIFRISQRDRRLRQAAVIGGLAIGMLALGIAVVAGLGVARSLQNHLASLFPSHRVVLRPKTMDALWLRFETAALSPKTLEAVRGLPGVVRVSPEATVRFPISAEGNLVGNSYRTDLTVTGVEGWLLGEALPPNFTFDPDGVLPAILSEYFLDLYNMALAESNKLPKFSPSAIVGRSFTLILGESTLRPASGYVPGSPAKLKTMPGEIVALTNNPDLLGLMVPLEAVEAFNAWYGLEEKRYRALHVELDSPERVDALAKQVEPLGLEVNDRMGPWRRVLQVVRLAAIAFIALGALVFILALAYMASALAAMLAQRRRELALYRALGASPRQILGIVLAEIALLSALGIAAGLAAAILAARLTDHWYGAWRAYRTYLPESLFGLPWLWITLLGIACWLIALLIAYLSAATANRGPLSAILSRQD